jgi:hypothetical protein
VTTVAVAELDGVTTVFAAEFDGVTTVAVAEFDGVTTVFAAEFDGVTTVAVTELDGVTTVFAAEFDGVTTVAVAVFDGERAECFSVSRARELESDNPSEAQCPQNEQRRSQRCIHWFLLNQMCRSVRMFRALKTAWKVEAKNERGCYR